MEPVITHSSPSSRAAVRMSVAADPASGSEMPIAIVTSPLTTRGRIDFFWASVPNSSITRDGPTLASKTWNAAGPRLLGELLHDEQRVEQGAAGPAVLFGQGQPEEAELGQAPDLLRRQRQALSVPRGVARTVYLDGDLARHLA